MMAVPRKKSRSLHPLLGIPADKPDDAMVRVTLRLTYFEWRILGRIARLISPVIDPGGSEVVRRLIQMAGEVTDDELAKALGMPVAVPKKNRKKP